VFDLISTLVRTFNPCGQVFDPSVQAEHHNKCLMKCVADTGFRFTSPDDDHRLKRKAAGSRVDLQIQDRCEFSKNMATSLGRSSRCLKSRV